MTALLNSEGIQLLLESKSEQESLFRTVGKCHPYAEVILAYTTKIVYKYPKLIETLHMLLNNCDFHALRGHEPIQLLIIELISKQPDLLKPLNTFLSSANYRKLYDIGFVSPKYFSFKCDTQLKILHTIINGPHLIVSIQNFLDSEGFKKLEGNDQAKFIRFINGLPEQIIPVHTLINSQWFNSLDEETRLYVLNDITRYKSTLDLQSFKMSGYSLSVKPLANYLENFILGPSIVDESKD